MRFGSLPSLSAAISITGPGYKLVGPLSGGAKASRAYTMTAAGTAGETITIDGVVYTLRVAPTDSIAYEVKIGADESATITNIKNAINTAGGGNYSLDTPTHPTVTATSAAGVLTVTARVGGVAGNSIAVSETSAVGSWASGTLTGGADPDVVIPYGTRGVVLVNPNLESVTVGIATPPTKVCFVSNATGTVVGMPVTLYTPLAMDFDGSVPPTFYVHCVQTASFYIFYPEG